MSLLMRRRALLSAIDKVKNLFHIEKVERIGSWISKCTLTKEDNSLVFDNSSPYNGYMSLSYDCIDLKPNTNYTCRAIVTEIDNGCVTGTHIAGSMQRSLKLQTLLQTYDDKGIYIVNGYTGGYKGAESEIITRFTTPTDLSEYKYVVTRQADNMTVIFKDIVIVEGDTI